MWGDDARGRRAGTRGSRAFVVRRWARGGAFLDGRQMRNAFQDDVGVGLSRGLIGLRLPVRVGVDDTGEGVFA